MGLPKVHHYLSFDFNFVKHFGILKLKEEVTGLLESFNRSTAKAAFTPMVFI
jgi:hypothetical protein